MPTKGTVTEEVVGVCSIVQNGQWWVPPLAILLSAIIGGGIAYWSIRTNREIARKRATLDVILKSESDEYFERIYTVFASEKNRTSGLEILFKAETDNEKKAKAEVDNFLNHYELIAISIEQKILDESFYKDWMKSTYIRHFKESKSYIECTREANPNAYTSFQKLAEKWDKQNPS